MSYQINFTDSVNKGFIQVDNNTVNTETSLSLPGRTKSDYGAIINENLLHLLENFANNNPPSNPIEGQLWYDNTIGVDQLKVYDGTQWVSASSIKKGNFRPQAVESNLGDLWVDTANQQLRLYNGNEWLLVGPEFSEGLEIGAKPIDDLVDTTNVTRSVVINYVDGIPLLIVSKDEFVPKTPIPGFGIIKPGLNIANNLKYYGTAETAENLIVPGEGNVLASNFARRDRDNTFARPIRIQNNGGINIGETPTIQLAVGGASSAIFRNLASGGNIQFRLTQGTSSIPILTITPDQKVGINKANPNSALDVVGDLSISQDANIEGNLEITGVSIFRNNLTVEGDVNLRNLISRDINPDQTGRNIGSSSLRFNNVFAQSINASTFTGNFIGPLSGNATTASGWSSSVTLNFDGDVVATQGSIVFGTPGNLGVRQISLQLNPEFITNKPTILEVDKDDEILIIRDISGVDEIRKIKQENLVKRIPSQGVVGPVIPIGMITPYGGDTPPSGWLLCDGGLISRSFYEFLWQVIGYKFDPTAQNLIGNVFRLPDMRGRFPLGNTAMANILDVVPNPKALDPEVVTESFAGTVGQTGGSAEKTIDIENLPNHIHTLEGDAEPTSTKFYAVSNEPNAPDTGVDGLAPNLAGTAPGSFISQTGGVIGNTDQDLSVVNPYQTVNYIIYTGVHN